MIRRARAWLSGLDEPIPIGPIVYFRIIFGLAILAWTTKMIADGSVDQLYIEPVFHFPYPLFDWVGPLPGQWMHWEFFALAAASVGMIIGFAYRACALLVAVSFTHVFLIEKTLYQNHYYLMCLLAWIAVLLPAHRALSVDSLLRPSLQRSTVSAWTLWLLRFQIAIPYLYGGLAKLEPDWLRGQPMRTTLAAGAEAPFLGQLLNHEWCVWLIVYGGLLFDLLIVPALLWSRTRPLAFLLALGFHLTNATIFNIGVFPWLMGLATVLFFPPELLQRLLRLDRAKGVRCRLSGVSGQGSGFGVQGSAITYSHTHLLTYSLLFSYVVWQVVFPFRHFVYPGRATWTEQGHYFAWHMKLRGKNCALQVYATDPRSGRTGTIDLRDYISEHQVRFARDPAMIHELCQFIAQDTAKRGYPDVELRVWALVALNGRKPQLLIDPAVDLAHEEPPGFGCDWIMPLTEPLRHDAWDVPLEKWEEHFQLPETLAQRLAVSTSSRAAAAKLPGGHQAKEM
jgi:hypothetical protein